MRRQPPDPSKTTYAKIYRTGPVDESGFLSDSRIAWTPGVVSRVDEDKRTFAFDFIDAAVRIGLRLDGPMMMHVDDDQWQQEDNVPPGAGKP